MRKRVFGRQLSRDTNERKALFKSLMNAVVMNESIQTTEEKAKAIKGELEKLITKAKKYGSKADRFLMPSLSSDAMKKVITDIAPRFATRPGGYTRIIKIGRRLGDNARMVILEWVEKPVILTPVVKKAKEEPAEPVATLPAEAEIITEDKTEKKTVKKRTTKKKSEGK